MTVPAQVRKQSETVQALYDDMNKGDVTNPDVQPPSDPVPPVVNEPAAPVDQSIPPKSEDYEQKYRSLQGKYNAEVPRLSAQVRDLGEQVQHLQGLLASLSTPPAPAPASAAPKPASSRRKEVTEEDEKEYGDAIETMRRAARDEIHALYQGEIDELKNTVASLTGKLNQEVVPAVNNVAHRQQVSVEQQFWADLTALVPEWQAINTDPEFHTWLLETDPVSRFKRQTILEQAQAANDANWVAQIFEEWIGPKPQPAPVNPNPGRQSELDKQVSPGKSKGGSAPPQQQPKTYSGEDISKFYADVTSGKYKGRDAERARIEADIFAAQRDGRIT